MKQEFKVIAAACALAFAALPALAADTMPRSEWNAKVGECAQDAKALASVMEQLSAEDQVAFLAEVNEAISKMPGSDEVKAARFFEANSAAVRKAAKGNTAAVLAEVFATVPPEFLTDINERFAKDVFKRTSAESGTVSDDDFARHAKDAMAKINERCEKTENAGVRETFAVLMFMRASGGSPADLADQLVATMPDAKNREMAANEWIKPAMGDGQEQTYAPMLGYAQAGEEPDHAVVLRLTGPADSMALLMSDLTAQSSDAKTPADRLAGGDVRASASIPGMQQDGIGLNRIPRAYVASAEAVGGDANGTNAGNPNMYHTGHRGDEPGADIGDEPLRPTPTPTPPPPPPPPPPYP